MTITPTLKRDYLVKLAGVPIPKKFSSPEEIDRPVMVKATKAIGKRHFERRFPVVRSPEEYEAKCEELVKKEIGTLYPVIYHVG